MPRAYLRLDPEFYERKALDQKYPPGAVAAYIGCLCLAETQPKRGRFRDRRVLAVLLGSLGRWIPYLVEHGDLIEQEKLPRLYVDGWDEWQEGDWKVAERIARVRARTHRLTVMVTPDVTVPVTVDDTVGDTAPRLAEAVGGKRMAQDISGGGEPSNGSPRPKVKIPTQVEIDRLLRFANSKDQQIAKDAREKLARLGVTA